MARDRNRDGNRGERQSRHEKDERHRNRNRGIGSEYYKKEHKSKRSSKRSKKVKYITREYSCDELLKQYKDCANQMKYGDAGDCSHSIKKHLKKCMGW